MIKLLLSISFFRKKLLFKLKHKYFHELGYSIPVQSGYWAHLLEKDSYDSFSEIFIQQEYLKFIPKEPISRILDIGAHYGYFSLWLQSIRPEIKLRSLLVEPSPRCTRSLKNLINQKKLGGTFSYLQGAIGLPNTEMTPFYDRAHMAGSRSSSLNSEKAIQVKNITEKDLMENLPPPYDLIKCDIEGSEWEFLNNYESLIKKSKYLLLEWHSWHEGGGGLPQIDKLLESLNFSLTCSSEPIPAVGREGEVGLILLKNLSYDCS
jgi:FkbM family methyltransferase